MEKEREKIRKALMEQMELLHQDSHASYMTYAEKAQISASMAKVADVLQCYLPVSPVGLRLDADHVGRAVLEAIRDKF